MSDKRIYKYRLAVTDVQAITMPRGAQLLTVQIQGDAAFLWALIDNHQAPSERTIAIFGTGNPLPELCGEYIATFQTPPFVWHAFDVTALTK